MDVFRNLVRGPDGITVLSVCYLILRIAMPVMAMFIMIRCGKSLLGFRREPEVWAWLRMPTGNLLPVTHWENLIGRKKTADIVLDFATVSKNHAVLTRKDDGSWKVTSIGGRGNIEVNGTQVMTGNVEYGDTISLGGLELTLEPVSKEEARLQSDARTKAGKGHSPGLTLVLLTLFQMMVVTAFVMYPTEHRNTILTAYGILVGVEWTLFIGQKLIKRSGFEVETVAFFLMTIGLGVAASANPANMFKQLISMGIGLVIFLVLGVFLRNLDKAKKLRYVAAIAGIVLLAANLVLGRNINGSRNWIYIGSFSIQPSELVKICFVLAGASTMDQIVTRKNLLSFVIYTAFIGGCLVVLNDFGTAAVFFVGFLAIAFLRSSSYPNVALIFVGIGLAAVMVLTAVLAIRNIPHVQERFSGYGHIWSHVYDNKGYQQTRSLICIASGGIFGLGLGRGWMQVMAGAGASDTDLVFAFVSEEWGLLMACMMVIALAFLGLFVARSAKVGRSSFYTIGATAAISMLLVQAMLNFFGTVDFLPLTGVTFPFVSNGGSSMMCCWGLLAFIKACDTRQNASFAVKLSEKEVEKA
ncbi:MAG: FtsW/RodA/SpoVE family cell cycle protein [Oscillospiraceae bacterium]|nr:FtsW/RodA/SpoVE family cell cycle protein [Oscillospiraceae bacterium]